MQLLVVNHIQLSKAGPKYCFMKYTTDKYDVLPLRLHGYYIKYFISLRITYCIWMEPFNAEVHYSHS